MNAIRPSTGISACLAASLLCLTLLAVPPAALAGDSETQEFPGASHYLRVAYQYGSVLQTNDFLMGDNQSGVPIENFQSARIEFGWQTDGSKDWHHAWNFPSFGLGLYGANYNADEELGTPTSLYGFFEWPMGRPGRWQFDFLLAFGFTNDWQPYDPVNNPKNTAMGLGRSVHIEVGATAQYRLARRWSLIGGLTGTHFSNGGTQRPNHGLNQIGPLFYVKYDTDEPNKPPVRRHSLPYEKKWDLTTTLSVGKRNLDLPIEHQAVREEYGNQSYLISNFTAGAGYRFSYRSRVSFGLDFCYDGTVEALQRVEAANQFPDDPDDAIDAATSLDPSTSDNLELGVFAGYEIYAHNTELIVHFGYRLFTKDVPGRLPELYQRLGVRQFVYKAWFVGMNVRFHEIGSADNLEWTIGFRMR